MKKRIIIMSFFILTSSVAFCTEDSPQQFQGFDLAGYGDGGAKSWDLKGETADVMGTNVKLTNIVANAYGKDKMNLTAKHGTLDKASGNVHLEKDVVITTEEGAKLVTDSLDWRKKEDLVTTNDKVVLTKEGMTATGTGAEAKPGLNTATMKENVTVNIETKADDEPGKIITITSDGPLEVDYGKQTAIFHDNVIAIESDKKIMADKITVTFDSQSKTVKQMICSGNVAISQGENTSYSDEAIYKAEEQKLMLTGRPKLILFMEKGQKNSILGQ